MAVNTAYGMVLLILPATIIDKRTCISHVSWGRVRKLCAYKIGLLNLVCSINYDQTHFITSFTCHFTQVNMVWRPTDTVSHVVLNAVCWLLGHKSIFGNSITFTFAFHMPSTASKSWQWLRHVQTILCSTRLVKVTHIMSQATSRQPQSRTGNQEFCGTDQIYIYLRHFSLNSLAMKSLM